VRPSDLQGHCDDGSEIAQSYGDHEHFGYPPMGNERETKKDEGCEYRRTKKEELRRQRSECARESVRQRN